VIALALGLNCHPQFCPGSTSQGGDAAEAPAVAAADAQKPELVVQAGHAADVDVVSFSPDGKLLASGSGKGGLFSLQPQIVKLWDVATGRELRTFFHSRGVVWVAFSPDGKRVAAKGPDEIGPGKIEAWDIATGKGAKADAEFVSRTDTPDGKIAAVIDGKNIILRDVATGNPVRTLASRNSDFQKVLFSPDSTVLATGGDRFSIRMWDLRSGVLRTLEGHTDFPHSADFSPDSRLFASGGRDRVVRLWDVASGRQIKAFAGHTGHHVRGIEFSPDGKRLVSYDEIGFKLWDVASGRELAAVAGDYGNGDDIHFNPQGNLLAALTKGGVTLWSPQTGQVIGVLPGEAHSIAFNSDGKVLMTYHFMKHVNLWNVESGKQIATIYPSVKDDATLWLMWPVFSPNGQMLAVSEMHTDTFVSRYYLYAATTGKLLRTITCPKNYDGMSQFSFSADGKWLMGASDHVWDVGTGKPINFKPEEGSAGFRQMFALTPQDYLDQDYSPWSANGAYEAGIGVNGEICLRDPRVGRDIATLIGIDERDWLVATSEGFFDGSPAAWKQIYWRFNNDTFNYAPLEAFFNEFYHPGLLSDALANKSPTLPAGIDLSRIDRRQPRVAITQVDNAGQRAKDAPAGKRTITLAVDIEENAAAPTRADHPATSGARDVRLFRNGSLVKAWRGDVFTLDAADGCRLLGPVTSGKGRRLRCEVKVPLVAGANAFTAYAFNDANVKSTDATMAAIGAESLRREATLHVLAIGVNQHDYQPLNLRYAVADAQSFAAEIKRQQKSLKHFPHVETKLLVDKQATKRNILAALAELAHAAHPEDAVIVYFAGHGTAEGNQFYLIPHDIGYAEDSPKDPDDGLPELLRRSVSDRELERAFEQVDAAQILFVIDACNSGQALEADEKRRGPMNSKGLAQLAYEKGMHVLTAAQGYQAAQEVSKLGHGLLTYVLVEEGLKRSAANAGPHDGRIDMREWLDYATRRVPQIQLHEMELASARGANLAFADNEQTMSLAARSAQRPRMFYRSDTETTPMIMAIAGTTPSPAIADFEPGNAEQMSKNQLRPAQIDGAKERGFLGVFRKGPAEDLKADIVEEQSGVYHTLNRTQAVLGTYGKMIEGNRLMGRLPKFEHRGLVQELDHVRRFATVQRRGQSAGKDFLSLFGSRQAWQVVNLGGKISGGRENEVAYEIVGVRLDQTDVIKALNADTDALTYFDYLASQEQAPCVVLENLVFTNYTASQGTNLNLGVTAKTTLTPDSVEAQVENERSSSTEFTSPVIRCYQMYGVKLHQGRVVELAALEP
jgi:WD40 repeat protein